MSIDYSKYECPYTHIEKECGHELKDSKGYENIHSVWCECGFRGPVFCFDPSDLNLKPKVRAPSKVLMKPALTTKRRQNRFEELTGVSVGKFKMFATSRKCIAKDHHIYKYLNFILEVSCDPYPSFILTKQEQ